jgi:transposase
LQVNGEGSDMPQIDLTRRDRRRLERQLKDAPTIRVYRRTLALLEIADGRAVSEVARLLRASRAAVNDWVARYTEHRDPTSLVDLPVPGRPSFWAGETGGILREALEQSPDALGYMAVNWSVPLLRTHIEKETGSRPSAATVSRELHRLGYVWKRPRHTIPESKSPRVRRRLRRLRKQVKDLPSGCVKLFEDETDLLLFPPLRAGWFRRGKPAHVPITGENAKRTIFGAINIETGGRLFVAREGECAIDFQVLLRLIRQQYGKKMVAVLLDGASRHTAGESQGLAAELGIVLLWLPSHCLNVNPMDRLWKEGKDKICANKQQASIDYQAQFFIEYLLGLSAQKALRAAGLLSKRFWLFR